MVGNIPCYLAYPVLERSNDLGGTFLAHDLLDEMRQEHHLDVHVIASEVHRKFEQVGSFLFALSGNASPCTIVG